MHADPNPDARPGAAKFLQRLEVDLVGEPPAAVGFGQRHREQPELTQTGEDIAGKGVVTLGLGDARRELTRGEVASKPNDRFSLRREQHPLSWHTQQSTTAPYRGTAQRTTIRLVTPASTRQHQLLDELVDVFLAEGFRSLTLAELATRLHCSKTTLYQLGHSKEQVAVNAIVHFFRQATESVEAETAVFTEPADRITAYLTGVANALRPASPAFMADLAEHRATRALYERNTRAAAKRVRELISEGINAGTFREVHGAFVADTVAATMLRIQTGQVLAHTGLHDAQAYEELASLVLNGIRS